MTTTEFLKRVLVVAVVALSIAIFWMARSVMVWAFFAIVIAVGINVPAGWFQSRGMKRGWALLLSIAIILAGCIAIILLIVPAIVDQTSTIAADLPLYVREAAANYNAWRDSSESLQRMFPAIGQQSISAASASLAGDSASGNGDLFDSVVRPILSGLESIVVFMFTLGLWLLIAVWLAAEPGVFRNILGYLVPRERQERARDIFDILGANLKIWIRAQSISIAATSALVYVVLGLIMGLPYAIVIAVLSGVATLIPNIGAFIPLIPITIFGLSSSTPERTPWWLLVYLLCQLIESNYITPSIVKMELKIPPAAMMIFQLVIAVIFGPAAMLLSVPLFTVVIVLVREIYSYDALGLRPVEISPVAKGPPLASTSIPELAPAEERST